MKQKNIKEEASLSKMFTKRNRNEQNTTEPSECGQNKIQQGKSKEFIF